MDFWSGVWPFEVQSAKGVLNPSSQSTQGSGASVVEPMKGNNSTLGHLSEP